MREAHLHMPQGVAENYRYWGDDKTVFVASAKGCRLTDCDGKQYVDFRLGYGPIILGYRDERVDAAVVEVLELVGLPKRKPKSSTVLPGTASGTSSSSKLPSKASASKLPSSSKSSNKIAG